MRSVWAKVLTVLTVSVRSISAPLSWKNPCFAR